MFRTMKRTRQQLTQQETEAILHSATSGVLALLGDEDYPYAVPLSYVYAEGKLYFHGGMNGHKMDAIRKHNKASFCVIAQDDVVPSHFTTRYRSVIAFGRVYEITDAEEKRKAITALTKRYSAAYMERGNQSIEGAWDHLCMLALDIEHMTGKESLELTESRA